MTRTYHHADDRKGLSQHIMCVDFGFSTRAELIDLFSVSSAKEAPCLLLTPNYTSIRSVASYVNLPSLFGELSSAWRGNSSLCLTSFGAPAKSISCSL